MRTVFPSTPSNEQRLYLEAAISYISYKGTVDPNVPAELRKGMALAHPLNPNSTFAKELRAEHAKGLEQGLEQGVELKEIEVVLAMLADGMPWDKIEKYTHLDQAAYEALKTKYGS